MANVITMPLHSGNMPAKLTLIVAQSFAFLRGVLRS